MNEKVVKCVGDKAWDERMRGIKKQTLGVSVTSQNSQLLAFSLPIEEVFSGARPRFSFSAARNAITRAEHVTFRFAFPILVSSDL